MRARVTLQIAILEMMDLRGRREGKGMDVGTGIIITMTMIMGMARRRMGKARGERGVRMLMKRCPRIRVEDRRTRDNEL